MASKVAPQDNQKNIKETDRGNWVNWFVPLLLVLTGIGFLLFYPEPEPSKRTDISITKSKVAKPTIQPEFKANEIANTLVSTFFNGSEKDKTEQIRALENTLNRLNKNSTDKIETALDDLKVNNINNAIEALASVANQQNNLRDSAKLWIDIGNIQNLTSTEQALMAYQKASELDANNKSAWNRQGDLHRQLKQFELAEIAYKKARSLNNQSTNDKALSLANFGLLNQSKGKLKEAEIAFLNALKIYTEIDDKRGIASTSENLASLYKSLNSFNKSEKYYLSALQINKENNNFQNMASQHTALADLYQSQKSHEKAQDNYKSALRISQENSFKGNLANLYNKLGLLAQQRGDIERSKAYFEKSLTHSTNIQSSVSSADQYGKLAISSRKQKNYAIAESYHKKAIEIYQHNNHTNGVISQKINLGFLYKAWQKNKPACTVWQDSLVLLKRSKSSRIDRIEKLLQTNCQ